VSEPVIIRLRPSLDSAGDQIHLPADKPSESLLRHLWGHTQTCALSLDIYPDLLKTTRFLAAAHGWEIRIEGEEIL